ncbi:MAG: PD40 domain-containing protein [Acidobacteria bacterium]|nr:PD40 domain-containing protein [Acidobacteriota bacterium]
MFKQHFNSCNFKMKYMLAALFLIAGLASQARASFPVSGTLGANDTQPLSWLGTASGPASLLSTPLQCREGIDCDTFVLTIGGTTADWAGKTARVRIDWQLLTSNFDLYVLKETLGAPVLVAQSAHSLLSGQTHESLTFNPGVSGTGRYLVRVMYTQANFNDQYRAVAGVNSQVRQNGKIAFSRSTDFGTTRQIYSMEADGTNVTQLTTLGSNQSPVFSPDGTKIAFFSTRDGNLSLYVMDASGLNQRKLGTVTQTFSKPRWSPDGTQILFDGVIAHDVEIYVVNADGNGFQRPLTLNTANDYYPVWSPDGNKILFMSQRAGAVYEIFVMDSDGNNQTQLTNTPVWGNIFPAWSPDGSKIAYLSPRTGNYEIYVMNPDGSNQTRLTDNTETDWNIKWSPDGSKIAHERGTSVYVMNADGSGQTKLTLDGGTDWQPVWSPDGTKLLFKEFRDDNEGIYLMNANGTGQTGLTSNGYDDEMDWQSQ